MKFNKSFLEWEILNVYSKEVDVEDRIMYNFLGHLAGVLIWFLIVWPLDALLPVVPAILISIVIAEGALQGMFNLGRLHALYGIEDEPYNYRQSHSLRSNMRRYYALPKADRREFPSNIETLVRNPDLTAQQKHDLSENLEDTLRAVEKRNEVRNRVARRNIDISDTLAELERARQGVNAETEVYVKYKD